VADHPCKVRHAKARSRLDTEDCHSECVMQSWEGVGAHAIRPYPPTTWYSFDRPRVLLVRMLADAVSSAQRKITYVV
jgi:hypothetical protein